jgi:transposase InsO family protein
VIKLARSSFYHMPKGKSPEKMQKEADLRDRIEAICLEFPRYGYRRITQALKREGLRVNHKKVLRLMKESDLLCQVKCKWKKTTEKGVNSIFHRSCRMILAGSGTSLDSTSRKCRTGIYAAPLVCRTVWKNRVDPILPCFYG